jgi:hypothetical protein
MLNGRAFPQAVMPRCFAISDMVSGRLRLSLVSPSSMNFVPLPTS